MRTFCKSRSGLPRCSALAEVAWLALVLVWMPSFNPASAVSPQDLNPPEQAIHNEVSPAAADTPAESAIEPIQSDGVSIDSSNEPTESANEQPSVSLGIPGEEYDPLFDEWDDDFDRVPVGFPDPFEQINRGMLMFNGTLDRFVLDPVTQVYRLLLPESARRSIVRVLDNLNSPQVLVNDGLQLEWADAGVVVSRLAINSTVGIGGLFDPASKWGLESHQSDFGQTLAIAGAPSGTYLMLPVLGPTNIRDGIGLGVDAFLHPTFYLLGGTDLLLFGGSAGLSARARHYEELRALRESSVDVYAAMRSGFYQNRQGEIWARRENRRLSREASAESPPGEDASPEPSEQP